MSHSSRRWAIGLAAIVLASPLSCGDGDEPVVHGHSHSAASASEGSDVPGFDTLDVDPQSVLSRKVYADPSDGSPVLGAIEYTPDYPLWSDGVSKRRWILLPADTRIDTSDMEHWQFPVGTKLVKEFSLDGIRLETRVIEKIADTGNIKKDLDFATYVWLEDQSDAFLTKDGVIDVLDTPHNVPKQKQCTACHSGEPGGALGFSALQLSASGTLMDLASEGLLSDPPERTFEILGSDIEREALGRMHANCGHCHMEGTTADFMRLRVLTSEVDGPIEGFQAYLTTVNQDLVKWEMRPPDFEKRIVPGNPEASAIYYRMSQRDSEDTMGDQMPPLATELVDEAALEVVRAFIEAMEPIADDAGPPAASDAGTPDADLDAAVDTDAQDAADATDDATQDASE